MKPTVEHVSSDPGCRVRLFRRKGREFPFEWHHHQECELTLIEKGRGTRFVGDSVESYGELDMVLLGPWLPHSWCSGQGPQHSALVFQIDSRLLAADWPELEPIRLLNRQARHGLVFSKPLARWTRDRLTDGLRRQGVGRSVEVIRILDQMASAGPERVLSKAGFGPEVQRQDERIEGICAALRKNLDHPPGHTQLARQFGLTPPSLSRAFKRVVGCTLSQWLAEERIGLACSFLIETDRPITQICYDSGFQNVSTFNRTFRLLKRQSPAEFRAVHRGARKRGHTPWPG